MILINLPGRKNDSGDDNDDDNNDDNDKNGSNNVAVAQDNLPKSPDLPKQNPAEIFKN